MPDPDPCCPHETQLDAAVRDLAHAHGRPEAAERVARGMATMPGILAELSKDAHAHSPSGDAFASTRHDQETA